MKTFHFVTILQFVLRFLSVSQYLDELIFIHSQFSGMSLLGNVKIFLELPDFIKGKVVGRSL